MTAKSAFVASVADSDPWVLEDEAIATLDLSLNLKERRKRLRAVTQECT
jgi:hypothetical protein